MPRTPKALLRLPPRTSASLEALGAHLAVARVRRRESLASWAKRVGVSIPTLSRMESGDPSVAAGIYATALWLIGRDSELSKIASPEFDKGALELDISEAVALGQKRSRSAERSRAAREQKAKPSADQAKIP